MSNGPTPAECHHWRTVEVVTGDDVQRVGECPVCGLTVRGFWCGPVPPCTPHHHGPA